MRSKKKDVKALVEKLEDEARERADISTPTNFVHAMLMFVVSGDNKHAFYEWLIANDESEEKVDEELFVALLSNVHRLIHMAQTMEQISPMEYTMSGHADSSPLARMLFGSRDVTTMEVPAAMLRDIFGGLSDDDENGPRKAGPYL